MMTIPELHEKMEECENKLAKLKRDIVHYNKERKYYKALLQDQLETLNHEEFVKVGRDLGYFDANDH